MEEPDRLLFKFSTTPQRVGSCPRIYMSKSQIWSASVTRSHSWRQDLDH